MRSSRHERKVVADYSARFAVAPAAVLQTVERSVIGEAWGAHGYTTVAQADLLLERLNLTPAARLFDMGTGRGWPGLYLAKRSGCEVVLTDLPSEGLKVALARASQEGVTSSGAVVASARRLPFRPASFDAVVHTDVLC